MSAILDAEQVGYRYAGSRGAVGPFDFRAGAGEFHLLSGPSGCGKSTLARMLCGLIPHLYRGTLSGRMNIGGQPTESLPLWRLGMQVGFVSQNPAAQLLSATVRDEISFGLENIGLRANEIESRVQKTLDAFGLHLLAPRDPQTLSGGEQQKVVIAAASARRPEALVLDEPVSMLDAASASQIVRHLQLLSEEGTAVVAFEHRAEPFAAIANVRRRQLTAEPAADALLPDIAGGLAPFRLVVEGLGVRLGRRDVLKDIDLKLSGGEVVALVGANGAGKTTLLRALVGLQRHTGSVVITGAGQRRLGLCFDNPDRQLFNASVRAEILYGLTTHDATFYRSVLHLLGLSQYEHTPPLLLSEGEKKRLAVAIALLRPGLCGLCLDEPTLGQDARQRRLLGRILQRLAAAGYLCVVATHDLEWAAEWANRILLLQAGRAEVLSASRAVADTDTTLCHVEAH